MGQKFFICEHCGNIIELIKDSGVPIICCGEKMKELTANVSDGAVEKHIPETEISNQLVKVQIGSVKHPMIEEHYIEWIWLNTNQGVLRKKLEPDMEPVVEFMLSDGEKAEEVYAYCNIHGLWKKDL